MIYFKTNELSYTIKTDDSNEYDECESNAKLPSISVKDVSNNDIAYFLSSI
jgi:hypothetical protein